MQRIIYVSIILVLMGCASQEMLRVRQMDIQDVDIGRMPDGEYIGTFTYGGFEYRVRSYILSHKIAQVKIEQNRDTRHARMAEAVVPRIIAQQTPAVDAVSGATTTSKALMKAVENSLSASVSK